MKRKIFLFSAKLLFLMTVFLSFASKNTFGQNVFTATYGSKTENFSTFQEALQFSEYDADDITITQNSDYERYDEFFGDEGLNSANKTTLSGKNITANLTHKLSDTLMVKLNSGKLIFNCTEGDVSLYAYFELSGTAELELNGGHYDFFKEIINIGSGCTATINNVTFVTDKNSGDESYGWSSEYTHRDYSYYIENNGGTLNINGGNFSCYSDVDWYKNSGEQGGYGIYAPQGTTNITDGEFTGLDYALSLTLGASAELSGGTFTATNKAAIFNGNRNTNNLLKSGYAFFDTETGAKINANFAESDLRDDEDNLVKGVLVKADGEPYVELSSDGLTLTFKYDTKRNETSNTTYDINLELQDNYLTSPAWVNSETKENVKIAKIDESFNKAKPKQCVQWFRNLGQLVTVEGLKNINTSKLERVSSMFANCPNLKNIDFTGFTTDNITNMSSMFQHSWSITELDLSGFNTQNVENFSSMFGNCRALTTIKVGPNWKVKDGITYQNTVGTFTDCEALIGDKGTTYDDNKRDADYAHIDEGESNPGYLSTGDYKIFYQYADDETGKYYEHTPATFKADDLPITLNTPEDREGYIFKGWTLNSASSTTVQTPSTEVTINAGETGNRIYTMHWASTTHSLGKGAHYNFEISGDDGSTEYTFDPITNAEGKTLVSISKESGKWYVNTTEYAVEGSTYTLTANGHNDIAVKVKIKNYTPEDLTENDGKWVSYINTIYVQNTVFEEDYPYENSFTITLLDNGATVNTEEDYLGNKYFDFSGENGVHTLTYTITLTNGSIVTNTEHKINIDNIDPANPILKITHEGTTEDYNGHNYNLNSSRAFFIGDKIQFYAEDKKPDDEFTGEISGIDYVRYTYTIGNNNVDIKAEDFEDATKVLTIDENMINQTLYYTTIDKAGNEIDTLGITIKLAKLKATCKKSETDATPTTQYFGDLKDALTSDYYPNEVKYITIEPLEDNYTDPTKAEIYINGDKHFEFSPGEKKFTGTYRIIADESGSSLTINGGTFNGLLQESEDSDDYYTMISCENGTITITGGSFTNNYGSVIAISEGTLKISGGEFKSTKGNALEYTGGTVELSSTGSGADEKCPTFSGQLYSFYKAVRNNALKDGYAFYGKNEATNDFDMIMSEDMDEEATSLVFDCDVKVGIAPDPAFQVGNEKFIMLSAAINAANSNSKPITQLRDYTAYTNDDLSTSLTQNIDLKGFTLDLNGKTLNIDEYTEVTITGTGEDEDGNPTHGVITSSNTKVISTTYQPLNLKDVTIKTTNTTVAGNIIDNGDNLNLFAGTIIEGGNKDKNIEPFRKVTGMYSTKIAFLDEDCEAIGYTSDNQEYVLKPDLSFSNKTGDYIGTKIKIQKAEYFYAEYTIGGEEVKKYFPTLRKAITEDNYKKDENYPSEVKITLKKPFESTEQMFMNYPTNEIQNINFNIDLSGYSYIDTCLVTLSGGKTHTIKGGENTKAYHHYDINNGELNITNGSFEFYTEIIKLQAGCTANLKGVTFIGGYHSAGVEYTHSAEYTAYIENNGGTLNIENGTFSYYDGESISISIGRGIYTKAGTTTIEAGTFNGKETYLPAHSEGGTTVISGGTFSDGAYGLYVTPSATGATESSISLSGGTFEGTTAAVYNNSGKKLLKEGYAFYTVKDDGSTGDLLTFKVDGKTVYEYYNDDNVLSEQTANTPYTKLKVDQANPMASPKELTLGKDAKVNFVILNAEENATYTFDPITDGTKTLITAEQESGKWYVKTTENVVDGSTYTLKAKEDENVYIEITIKDFFKDVLEQKWYRDFTVYTSSISEAAGFKIDESNHYIYQNSSSTDIDTDHKIYLNGKTTDENSFWLDIDDDGEQEVTLELRDDKGNVYALKKRTVNFDSYKPSITIECDGVAVPKVSTHEADNANEVIILPDSKLSFKFDDNKAPDGSTLTGDKISAFGGIIYNDGSGDYEFTDSTTAATGIDAKNLAGKTVIYYAFDKAGNGLGYDDSLKVTFALAKFKATYKQDNKDVTKYFTNLKDALTSSNYPGEVTDITIENHENEITDQSTEEIEVKDKNFVFSFGDNTLTGTYQLNVRSGKLTINGSSNCTFLGVNTGSTDDTPIITNNGGEVTITNCNFSNNYGSAIKNVAGTLKISGGTITGRAYGLNYTGGVVELSSTVNDQGEETAFPTFTGTNGAIYNGTPNQVLKSGYAFYYDNKIVYKKGNDGSINLEPFNEDHKLVDGVNIYNPVTVKKAQLIIEPSEITLGKGAKYNIEISNADENTTFKPLKDGTKTLITAEKEDGKWYVKTADNVVDGSYTLCATDNSTVNIKVVIKDYFAELFDGNDDWYNKNITVKPAAKNNDNDKYSITVQYLGGNGPDDKTANTDYTDLALYIDEEKLTADKEYISTAYNVKFELRDSKNNVLASSVRDLKIEKNSPTVAMKETETGNEVPVVDIIDGSPQNTNEYEVCEGTEFTISMDDTQDGTITDETAISGFWQIAYKLVGASEYITESTTATFTVNKTDYDNKTMLYFAIDKAGNHSDTMEVTFKVFEKNFQATYKENATATVNTVQYFGTLQSALTASKYPTTTTSEITIEPVNNNFTETIEEEFEVNTKNFVFSPGNKTFTGTYRIKVIGGKLTINGGKFYGLHRTDDLTTTTYPLITNTGGEVTITGGELVNSYGSAIKNEFGTTKISGGTLGSSINYAIEYTSGIVEISSTSDNDGNETAFPKISGQIVAIYNYPDNNVLKNGYAFYTANGKMLYFKKDNDNSVIFEKYNNTTSYLETGIPNQELTIKKIQREIDPLPIIVGKGADITLDIIEPSPTTHEFTAIEVTIKEEKKVAATLVYNTTDKKYHLKTTHNIPDGEYTFTSKTNTDVKVKFTVKDYVKDLFSGLKDTDGKSYKWTSKEVIIDPATETDNKMFLGLWIGASALNHNIVETSYASDLKVSINNTDITETKSYNTEGINPITYNLKNSYGILSSESVDIKIDKTAPNVAVLKITKDETTTTYEGGATTNPTKISFVAGTRIVIHADDKQNGTTPNSDIYQVAFSKVGSTDTSWYRNDDDMVIMAADFGDYVLKSWDSAGNKSDVKYVRLLQTLSLELEAANWVYDDTENHKHKVINTEDNSEITTGLTFHYKTKNGDTYSTTKPTAVDSYTVKAVYETATATGETEPVDFDIQYKVQFVSAYGSAEPQLLGADSKATEPTMSEVSGYKLLGWYYTPEGSTVPTKWNFNTTVSGNLTLTARWAETISAAEIAALINLTKEYDRGIYATAGSGDNKRELYNSGSDVTLTYNGIDLIFSSVAFNTRAVGEGKTISATPVAVEYVKDNNYYVIDNATANTPFVVSTEGIITAKELTATLVSPEKITKVYDGKTNIDISNITANVSGVITGENVSVKVVSGEYPNANAGSYTVELTLELDGDNKANYMLTNNNKLNVNGEITQAELSLPEDISSYVETEKTYDGTTTAKINEATYQSATIASATYDYEYASQTRTITVNFQLSETGNYCFKNNDETVYTTSKTYSGKITPVKLSSSILADNLTLEKEYDGGVYVTTKSGNVISGGSDNLLSCNGIPGETVQFYFSAAAYDEANIGDRLVTVQPQITSSNYVFDSSDDDDNDDEVFAFNARITPKPVTVTEGITAKSKVYDGTTAAELDLSNIVISGVITGETAPEITATGEFEDANAGENKTVNITMQIAENSNYVLSESGNQTTTNSEITRKVITTPQITIQSDYDFVYDGQPKTPTVTVALDGQEIDLSEFTLTFRNNTNAGTATVTVSTSEGGNYELSNDHVLDFTIEKAEATTITTEAAPIENLMYDGTPKTLITAAQSPDGEIVYRLENETEFSKELPSATAAGRYTVYYKVVGDENHTDSKEFSVEATIIPQNMKYTLGQNASVQLAVFGEFTFTSDNENITVENVNGEYFLKTNSNVKDGDKATVKSDMHIISVSIINPMKNLNIESEWTNGDVKLPAPDMSGFDEDCSLYINGHKVENIDNEVISEEGENKVEYEIKDQNDNVVANQEIIIKIDKTAPITVAKAESQQVVYELKVGLEIAPKYFFIAGAVAMFEATDALSGIANAEMSWDNQNDFHAFDLKDVVNLQSGKHTLYVKISDNAGNSAIYNAEFMIFDESKFSNGSNSQKSPATYYGAELPEPQSLELQLNNNTIYAVKDLLGNVFLASQSGEITIEGNKINISEEYLKKVSPDNNKLYIYINPLGQQAWKDDLSAEEYESQILVYEFDIKYEVKINDDYKFFSEENSDLNSFCNGDKVSMTLSLDESFSTADYISIPALGISKVEFSTKLSFVVPSGTLHGGNEKLVVEFFKNNFSSTDYVNFPADYPSENNIRVYDDVLAIDNGLHTIEDGSYIWYMDSKELQGENLQFLDLLKYLTDNQTHTFYVSVVDKNSGIRFRVCPSEDFTITPISKRKAASVNVYPNPAESNKTFNIELDDFSEEYFPRTEIIIYNYLGTLVKKISDVEKVNPVSLNAGFYSGTVLISGKKVLNFKIIVK